jgi:hypothetical protein
MRFPAVKSSNLLRRKITLPYELQGDFNFLFIPFQQWHQRLVDGWVPMARQIEASFPGVRSQTFINEGMRAGIPNQTTREKTITLYIDKKALRRALEIPNELIHPSAPPAIAHPERAFGLHYPLGR